MHRSMPSTLEAKSYQTMYVLANNICVLIIEEHKWQQVIAVKGWFLNKNVFHVQMVELQSLQDLKIYWNYIMGCSI